MWGNKEEPDYWAALVTQVGGCGKGTYSVPLDGKLSLAPQSHLTNAS
jgi:hypothetical protein